MKIVHISTVHLRTDSRIRSKMMTSLESKYPQCTSLMVQDGLGDEIDELGYPVIDTGPRLPRLMRMSLGGWRMFRSVLKRKPVIAHFHDPELIPWGIMLRLFGIEVIYDVHEDYPEAVSENYRLPRAVRKFLPRVVRFVEWVSTPFFSAVVSVTPQIQRRFPHQKSFLVRNWPWASEFRDPAITQMHERPKEIAYIGTITRNRNVLGMIEAIGLVGDLGARLRLAGDFAVISDRDIARQQPGWKYVDFDGYVSRDAIADILANARAGLVVLKPVKHEMITLPIKLFEYMAAGIPVIASDFPLWREIVVSTDCGFTVDPDKPEEIAHAIKWILEHPDESSLMGRRGRAAVLERFNWESEAKTLISMYDRILGR